MGKSIRIQRAKNDPGVHLWTTPLPIFISLSWQDLSYIKALITSRLKNSVASDQLVSLKSADLMDESFQDYSCSQDFEADFP